MKIIATHRVANALRMAPAESWPSPATSSGMVIPEAGSLAPSLLVEILELVAGALAAGAACILLSFLVVL
jgi:hypothetical protein